MEPSPLAIAAAEPLQSTQILHSMALAQASSSLNDSLVLSQWYQLHLQRLQAENFSIGLPDYLAHGNLSLAYFSSKFELSSVLVKFYLILSSILILTSDLQTQSKLSSL